MKPEAPPPPGLLPPLIKALRPHQWTKNAFVLAALVYADKLGDPAARLVALRAFAAFCMCSSTTYVLNDLRDREADRHHPKKRLRPIAAGQVSPRAAVALAVVCLVAGLGLASTVNPLYTGLCVAYLVQTAAYTLWLKKVVVLDVFVLASGFVMRAAGGALALEVAISPWLVLCTLTISLFLGFSKRRSELESLGEAAAEHRSILSEYTLPFLDQMISITATSAVLSYALYTTSPEVTARSGKLGLVATTPFVFYGFFRYLYLLHVRKFGADPARVLLTDRPLLACCLSWAAATVGLLYLRT